jgi:Lon protease-like protein
MLSDILAGDRRFGLSPVPSGTDAPDPGAVGCVAEVRLNQELPDGRSNIVVVGSSRFVIIHLLDEPAPYLVASVDALEEEPNTEPEADEVASLRELFGRYLVVLRELNDTPPEEPSLPDDAVTLSFVVAGSIECELEIKRKLLAERSTARRVRALCLMLPPLTRSVERGVEVHRRAHSNGKGTNRPDMLASQ